METPQLNGPDPTFLRVGLPESPALSLWMGHWVPESHKTLWECQEWPGPTKQPPSPQAIP